MRIRSQYIISVAVFAIILAIISVSVVNTNQQVTQINNQAQTAANIQIGASTLAYISNDYFLNKQNVQLTEWQTQFSTVSNEVSKINSNNLEQKNQINTVNTDLQNLGAIFNSSVAYVESIPLSQNGVVHPILKLYENNLDVQNQALAFDASVLSASFDSQANQVKQTNTILIFGLLGAFAAYFIAVYFIFYRQTFRSIRKLQDGTKIIGSGNLDYSIAFTSNDEIGELSQAFNQMTINLKSVTASKTDLEREIEERKKAEAQVTEQLQMLDLANVIVKNMKDEVIFWNSGAQKLYGFSKEEALGRIPREFLRTKLPKPFEQIKEELLLTGKWEGELIHTKANGSQVSVASNWTLRRDNDNKPVAIVETTNDITEAKKAEEKLEEYQKNLEKLVEERTKQLKDSERLAAIGATAGMVGHDIRNPLQAITGDVYLAKTELASLPESDEKKNTLESLTEIEKNIDYINKIVQDLQDYARPLNPKAEETDLKVIIAKLFEKNSWPDNIELSVKVENSAKKITTDAYYINRIMYNLIINAVQAMPNGGKLTVHAFQDPKEIVMVVKDTGIGIPKDIQGKLFTLMFTTKAKGQGFGLPVVKRMTESLGGAVTFESEEGKGTTFTVRLPLTR
jgi:PAS domain S-box-containing protein